MKIYRKITAVLALIAFALFSVSRITPMTTDVKTHEHSIDQIDKEIDSVLKLTAGATAASAGISLLPDDSCTPIAQQFAELAKYFVVVLSALYLEKYLVTLLGVVSFLYIIPSACVILCAGIICNRARLISLSARLIVTALAIYFTIPLSVCVSEKIYNTYENSIEETIISADRISIVSEDEGVIDKFISWIANAAGTVVDYVTSLLSRFIEAIAVMIVTSCLIPILVIVFFLWIIKVLFSLNFSLYDVDKVIRHNLLIEKKD